MSRVGLAIQISETGDFSLVIPLVQDFSTSPVRRGKHHKVAFICSQALSFPAFYSVSNEDYLLYILLRTKKNVLKSHECSVRPLAYASTFGDRHGTNWRGTYNRVLSSLGDSDLRSRRGMGSGPGRYLTLLGLRGVPVG